jgi:hypothetical protein
MDYTVRTTQNAAGLWNWSIYKGDLLAEADTSKGYTTEAEAREVSGHFLADHTADWMSDPKPESSPHAV